MNDILGPSRVDGQVLLYTCQRYLISRRDIFLLRMPGFFAQMISEDVRRLPKMFRKRPKNPSGQYIDRCFEYIR